MARIAGLTRGISCTTSSFSSLWSNTKDHSQPFGAQVINLPVGADLQDFGLQVPEERSNLKKQIPEKISVWGNLAHTPDKLVVPIPPVHVNFMIMLVRGIVQGRVETTKEGDCHNKALDTRAGRIAVGSSQGKILVFLGGQRHEPETALHTKKRYKDTNS